jgi:hypothetical protein
MTNERKFLVESGEGDFEFSKSTTRVWTMEEILREINRDWSCTDSYGNVCVLEDSPNHFCSELNSVECIEVLAGSPLDTFDHEGKGCFSPYNEKDWQEGWYNWIGEEYNRIIKEVTE